MNNQIEYCPLCGSEFDQVQDRSDSRSPSGYECDGCNEVLEIRINQFPLA